MNAAPTPKPLSIFLATARGGHSADPAARCPYCGKPSGSHRGVDLVGGAFFPMRAVICDTPRGSPEVSTEGETQ